MIQKEDIERGQIDENHVRRTITGKIDNVLQENPPVVLNNIFHLNECTCHKKFVLIEGAPGSGKSTLALHICQEWVKEKLFQEFNIVVLVRLRDPLIKKAKSIIDLLPCRNRAMAEEVGAEMLATDGRDILLVLDGWDELPSDFPQDSIINKLVFPGASQDVLLHKISLIITSRPSCTAKLHPLVSARLEVLGFTPVELEKYFTECLKGDSQAACSLLERIRENPVVESSCYLPFNASIIANNFLSGNHSLPTSNHEIFTSVVMFSLSRYMQDRLNVSPEDAVITSFDNLPKNIQGLFSDLCKLAYYGVTEDKITFIADDFKLADVSMKVSEVGLLQIVSSYLTNGQKCYYNFLHLSIQELLAAIHISHMPCTTQITVFQELIGNPRFAPVFQFYAGITKLKVCRPILSLLPKFFLPKTPRGILDLFPSIVKENNSVQIVSLLNCLCEAEDPSLYVLIADLFDQHLDLSYTFLSPTDCLSIGYFLSVVSTTLTGTFKLDLTGCCIGDQGCKFLLRGLYKYSNSCSKIKSQLAFKIRRNNIQDEGAKYLSELLQTTSIVKVSKLDLSINAIGENGFRALFETLSCNSSLEELDITDCSLIISDADEYLLYQLLSSNSSLKHLFLSGNEICNCHHLAAGLESNRTLNTLWLTNCGLTNDSLQELSVGLNNYIEELRIHRNNSITVDGVEMFARRLASLSKLRHLVIPGHLGSSVHVVFREVNEERQKNGLQQITIIDGEYLY